MRQFPVGDRNPLGEHRDVVDVKHRGATANADRTGGCSMEERRQLVVVAGCERSGHEVVTDTSGAEHHTILPAGEDPDTAAGGGTAA